MSDHELDTPVQDPTIENIPAPNLADAAPKKKKKRVGLIIILVLLLLGLIGGGLAFWFFGVPALQYNEAMKAMNAGNFDYAYQKFSELNSYEDSAVRMREVRYCLSVALLNNKQYDAAYKYNYIQAHYDRYDVMTYEYLTELRQEDYRDTRSLYQKLYAWHITNICVNSSSEDTTTNLPSISKYDPVYVHFTVTGGIPNGETRLRISSTHLNGEALESFFDPVTANSVLAYGWRGGVRASGTIRMVFYDDNNNKLADISIIIDDD